MENRVYVSGRRDLPGPIRVIPLVCRLHLIERSDHALRRERDDVADRHAPGAPGTPALNVAIAEHNFTGGENQIERADRVGRAFVDVEGQ